MNHQDFPNHRDDTPTPPPSGTGKLVSEQCNLEENKENINPKESDLDCILIQNILNGDSTAFTCLWERYKNILFHIIYQITLHTEDTWDILQETFLRVHQSLHTLKNPKVFHSWIISIATNLSINHIKKKDRYRKIFDLLTLRILKRSALSPCQELERKEYKTELQTILSKMSPTKRSAFVLSEFGGYSYKEIAGILNCNIGTVMSRLHYARNFIRERLDPVFKPGEKESENIFDAQEYTIEDERD